MGSQRQNGRYMERSSGGAKATIWLPCPRHGLSDGDAVSVSNATACTFPGPEIGAGRCALGGGRRVVGRPAAMSVAITTVYIEEHLHVGVDVPGRREES